MMIAYDEALEIITGKTSPPESLLMEKKYMFSKFVTYSKNVFIPLTHACRNRCGYCIFRQDTPEGNSIMPIEDVKHQLKLAECAGCLEALLTFGERPEEIDHVKKELLEKGYETMIDYLYEVCSYITYKTGLFAHSNPGILEKNELRRLRNVNVSMGLMLESLSKRLCSTIAHKNSPGKDPSLRIDTIRNAGRYKIPFTTGILLGIGETHEEIVDSLFAIRDLHDRYGHIQEIIIQNFVPKKGTPMESFPPASYELLSRTLALSRIIFPDIALQVPPNLNRGKIGMLTRYGLDDLGGISPITPDYVNPEKEWPEAKELLPTIRQRLPVYPRFITREYLCDYYYEKAKNTVDKDGYVRSDLYEG